MKRLFISDLDGTLLNSKVEISEKTAEIINKAIEEKGISFTVATARSYLTAVELTKKIKINAPMVLMNGVFIYDREKDEYIKYEKIDTDVCLKLIELMDKHNVYGKMYGFDGKNMIIYTLKDYPYKYPEDKKSPVRKVVLTDSFKKHYLEYPVVSFVFMDSFEKLKPFFAEIRYDERLTPCFYEEIYTDIYEKGLYWLEIYNSNVDKANGVEFVKKYLQAKELTAFGDNLNDIEMLKNADVSVAMKNAVQLAKDAADVVLELTNNEDGVAKYIENLLEEK